MLPQLEMNFKAVKSLNRKASSNFEMFELSKNKFESYPGIIKQSFSLNLTASEFMKRDIKSNYSSCQTLDNGNLITLK